MGQLRLAFRFVDSGVGAGIENPVRTMGFDRYPAGTGVTEIQRLQSSTALTTGGDDRGIGRCCRP